ncbi:MAG: phage/plasmid primase, P4 family [Thermodesulfobacteriota bacterium]|nr:phage/plasmid primase, P4 family [Thermodesulfobacteriota bacterium]
MDKDKPGEKSKDIRAVVEERVRLEKATLDAEKKKGAVGGARRDEKITSNFIQACSGAHEYGMGVLFAKIFKGNFICVLPAIRWLQWAGHSWTDDVLCSVKGSVESVVEVLLAEAEKISGQIREAHEIGNTEAAKNLQKTQHLLYRNIHLLHSKNGRNNILEFAHTNPVNGMGKLEEDFNKNPYDFGCKNGVIDLRTASLRAGRPDDFINQASRVEWTGINTPAPNWQRALNEIFEERRSLIDFIQRLFGYSLAGLTVEAVLPVLYGQGRNGKSTITETISHVMDKMAIPIRAELLLDQGLKSSAAASPDIMALKGVRLCIAQETDQGHRFSTSKIQWLTGSDTMTGRYLYDKCDVEFTPTHTLFLSTNHKPAVNDNDFAFWERVCLIPFPLSFVTRKPDADNERPADKNLREKLISEESGILAWLVRGFMQWQDRGLDPPPEVIDATKEYRKDEDLLGHFIAECCYEDPHAETSARDLFDDFKIWWAENVSRRPLSQKKFGSMMAKKYKRSKSGTVRYIGVGIEHVFE